ncbi:MAG: polysaccharide biosynthesis tyrosine autokinase [Alphaproteobacteria bacterium]|nr:polysaccharide biosynthesis tyrosine autokinase [Alphaproteobacteria bacterium]
MTNQNTRQQKDSFIIEMLHILKRRFTLLFAISFLGFALSLYGAQSLTPLYTAHSQIIFSNQENTFIQTQTKVLSSASLIHGVIKRTGLAYNPHYNQNAVQQNKKGSAPFKSLKTYDVELEDLSNVIIEKELDGVIKKFQHNLKVEHATNTYVLDIYFTSHLPNLSAHILNKLVDHYLEYLKNSAEGKRPEEEKQDNALIEKLKGNVNVALKNLEEFKDKQLSQTHYIPLSETYKKAEQDYIAAKTRFEPFQNLGGTLTLNEDDPIFLTVPKIRGLEKQSKIVHEKLQTLAGKYGPKHPEIIELREEFETVSSLLETEKMAFMRDLEDEYRVAREKFVAIQETEEKDRVDAQIKRVGEDEAFQALKAQAEQAIETFKAYEEVGQTHEEKNIAQILLRASPPLHPSHPKTFKLIASGTFLSLLLAILITVWIEKRRNSFLSGRQLEEYLDLPCYALIPKAPSLKDYNSADLVLDEPASPVTEAVRALRLMLRLKANSDEEKETKVITLSSSYPDEGKTTLSCWLARLAAKAGDRVILIDADLRRPSVHKMFGFTNNLSLVEYLTGQNKLEDVINTKDPSGLHIIYGRSVPNNAMDLLSSDKMDQLLRSLRKAYDLIIIDTPACLAVSDARAVNSFSDLLLYVVQWNKTKREVVHNGIRHFKQFGKTEIATVLANIDLKKHVALGYGAVMQYYENYKA